jgi:hypothetical protein
MAGLTCEHGESHLTNAGSCPKAVPGSYCISDRGRNGRAQVRGACESHLVRGLRLAELLGDQAAAADLLARLAVIATNTLRFDRALDYGQRAVAAGRAAGDDQALAGVLDELEPLLRRQGDLFRLQHAVFESACAQARAAVDRGAALAREHGLVHVRREARVAASLLR